MSVKLLTEHHLEFLSLSVGCTGFSESTLVKMSDWIVENLMLRLNYTNRECHQYSLVNTERCLN